MRAKSCEESDAGIKAPNGSGGELYIERTLGLHKKKKTEKRYRIVRSEWLQHGLCSVGHSAGGGVGLRIYLSLDHRALFSCLASLLALPCQLLAALRLHKNLLLGYYLLFLLLVLCHRGESNFRYSHLDDEYDRG